MYVGCLTSLLKVLQELWNCDSPAPANKKVEIIARTQTQ